MASMTNDFAQRSALLEGPAPAATPAQPMIVRVARAHGISPIRQLREISALRFGSHKLRPKDYYDFGLYAPEVSMEEKRRYVGNTGNKALNRRLSPLELIPTGAFVANKLLYTALLRQMGLETTHTQAVVSASGSFGRLPVLRTAQMLREFLETDAIYPLFGKPRTESLSKGSVRIEGLSGGQLGLGNGTQCDVADFCAEVMTKYGGAYILQTAITPHPDMAAVTQSAVGCVRVVTVNENNTIRPLYAVWKIPAPDAMSDNFWQQDSMIAGVDLDSGTVLSCRKGKGLDTQIIDSHPVSGAAITGLGLPHWQAVTDLAVEAHAIFPEFGVCGFDIGISEKGPHIIECNDSPHHTLYQLAMQDGIMNAAFTPVFDAVAAFQKQRLPKYAKERAELYKMAD